MKEFDDILIDIAIEKNIDIVTKEGKLKLLAEVLNYCDDPHKFLRDTLVILQDEVELAWRDIAEEV
jgi:hypothetical protein